MTVATLGAIAQLVDRHEAALLEAWTAQQPNATPQTRQECATFLRALRDAMQRAPGASIEASEWNEVLSQLGTLSTMRAQAGRTPSETATFVFSLKQALFQLLRREAGNDAQRLADQTWAATELLDRLGLYTMEVHQKSREAVIQRQQQEMLELTTPVVQLWHGIIALPLIGTLDSARTQVVMESLLQKIVETGASISIIDITGVPTVDTLVAQHLLKTVAAARLMGADCIISGIRPQIAQTIVHLGVDLSDVVTKSSLADALLVALRRSGASLDAAQAPSAAAALA